MVSDFKDKFSLKADHWEAVVFMFLLASVLWLVWELYRLTKDESMDSLLFDIRKNIKNTPDYTAIYFIKMKRENIPKILVYKNPSWKCYFLPYVSYSPDYPIDHQKDCCLERTIAGFLGANFQDISIEYLRNYSLTSEKYSESERVKKQFNFEFITVSSLNGKIANKNKNQFSVGGKDFVWMTLDELENDENTKNKNSDVLHHIRKNYSFFFNEVSDSWR